MALTRPKYSQIYDTDWKQSAELATTGSDIGNLTVGNLQPSTVDGVSVQSGYRILVKDQTRGLENGLYTVANVGTGSNGWWTRTLDTAQSNFVTSGMSVVIDIGSTNAGREFRLTTPDPITLGSTALTFQVVGTPNGANTVIQFNDNNFFGGSSAFTFNKTSNVVAVSGNLNVTNGNLNVTGTMWITGNILPTANVTYNLGSPTNKFKSAYFSGNTVYIGSESISVDSNGTWGFTSAGATVSMGASVPLNPPALFATGNVTTSAVYAPFIGNTGSALTGIIQTVSQPNITSVGNLTSLSIAGATTFYSAPVISATTNATTLGTGALIVQGGGSFAKDLYVGGNLYAANVLSLSYNYLTINEPLLYLQANTYPYNFSIGFYSHFIGGSANAYGHTGFVRSWTNNSWYLFSNVAEPIAGNVNVSDANLVYDPIYTGSHTVTGFINANGNVMASSVNAGTINTTGVINSSGNVSAAIHVGGAVNVSGNVLSTGAIHNSLTVNGTVNTNVASVASTILAGAVGVTGNIIANASVIYGNTSGGYGVRQFFNPITNSLDTVFG